MAIESIRLKLKSSRWRMRVSDIMTLWAVNTSTCFTLGHFPNRSKDSRVCREVT